MDFKVHRLRGDDSQALADLNKSLELSKGQGRSACQALCQRGMLYRKQHLDVQARDDFECAAKMGSEFAKSVLVQVSLEMISRLLCVCQTLTVERKQRCLY